MNLRILPFKIYLITQMYFISPEFLVYLNTLKNLHISTAAKIQRTCG